MKAFHPPIRATTAFAAALLGLFPTACGEEKPATPRIIEFTPAKHDPDFVATQVVDMASGVMVAQPSRAWQISGGLGPAAVASPEGLAPESGGVRLVEPNEKCVGLIRVGIAQAGDPKAAGTALLDAWCEGHCAIAERDFALYNSKTAWRFEGRKDVANGQVEMARTTVLVNPGQDKSRWLVVVEARGHGRDYAARRRCLDAITAAVSVGLAEGAASGVIPQTRPTR